MQNIPRPAPFVLISSNHGTMIINRNDYFMKTATEGYGVGFQIMNASSFDSDEVRFILNLLETRVKNFGPDVVAIDCGANVGVHTLEWARFMHGWGHVYAFEAQEKIFYALAGNVIINNCLNVTARFAALGAEMGTLMIPEPNYMIPSSFGSFELSQRPNNENIGQRIDYANATMPVPLITIDSLKLKRIDLMKIDVEGMEEEVLTGAKQSIEMFKPMLFIEIFKSNWDHMRAYLQAQGYASYVMGNNAIAVHKSDPAAKGMEVRTAGLSFQ